MLENFMDEFVQDQQTPMDMVVEGLSRIGLTYSPTAPLGFEYTPPSVMPNTSAHRLSSSSSHFTSPSTHSMTSSSILSVVSSVTTADQELQMMVVRLQKVYKEYAGYQLTSSGKDKSKEARRIHAKEDMRSRIASGREDVALCFREVPPIFFRCYYLTS